jgi:hypothetical protein
MPRLLEELSDNGESDGRVMKIRDNMSAVIEGLQRDHGLLAAYLEATDKIDWRALRKRVAITETPALPSSRRQAPVA